MGKKIENSICDSNVRNENLFPLVKKILSKRKNFLDLVNKHGTPFYVYDQKGIDESIRLFTKAFSTHVKNFHPYYAVKLNHHPFLIDRVIKKGMGLDVASKRELSMAIRAGATKIVYFGPGKSENDLKYTLKYTDIARMHIDSFSELRKIGEISNRIKKNVEVGVRINMPFHGLWSKYGISLKSLKEFWQESSNYPFIKLNGIHFHQSRNRTVYFYVNTIRELAEYLIKYFSLSERENIRYIDFGGGFEPYKSEGFLTFKQSRWPRYKILTPPTIEEYAQAIGDSIKKHLDPIVKATYLSEPGRYICNNAMHIVLSIADVKDKEDCILDGGVNMVGWQRFEKEYFPLINITHPDKKEQKCRMWGNLCTTWDIWGYYCCASKLLEKDVIVVPCQGALTYSLAQSFINDIPPVYALE